MIGTRKPRKSDRRAFTLVEALLASTVLAIAAASAAFPYAAGVQRTNEAARLEQAVALGQSLMEEILGRPFYEPGFRWPAPGPGPGETSRPLFDNLDDFDGYSEAQTGPRDYQNNAITDPACAGLWRDVSVQYVGFSGQQAADTNSFVIIRVRVWDGNEVLTTLYRLAARED